MSYFAAVVTRRGRRWRAYEVNLEECESVDDLAEAARDWPGDVRLMLIEQDDEYAVIGRVDADGEPRFFLSDGHAADAYPLAAFVADELKPIEDDDVDEELIGAAARSHVSAPFGAPGLVDDLGTSADELLALCAHEGTLPADVIATVCERAGCGDVFEAVRA
jgi:putative tRNA adenosine deaminase-associated protein